MAKKYETSIFNKQQLKSAHVKGQLKGWVQGAAATFLLMLLLNVVGWIPAIVLLAVIGFVGFRIFKGAGSTER